MTTTDLVAACTDVARHIAKDLPKSAKQLRQAAKKLQAQDAAITRFIRASDASCTHVNGDDIANMIEWNEAFEELRTV